MKSIPEMYLNHGIGKAMSNKMSFSVLLERKQTQVCELDSMNPYISSDCFCHLFNYINQFKSYSNTNPNFQDVETKKKTKRIFYALCFLI